MKRPYVSFIAMTFFVLGSLDASAQEQAAKPTFKEGDAWQFNVTRKDQSAESTDSLQGIYELNYTQGTVKAFTVEGSKKTEIKLDPNDGPSQNLLSWLGSSEQQQSLRFPLSAGQKWSYNYELRGAGSKTATRTAVEVNVTGIEQVTTPAGTFKAFKLVRDDSWVVGRPGKQRSRSTTYFFSPDTKSIIKSSSLSYDGSKTEMELIKFTPAN
jgi:hypothetical protein